MSKVYVVKCDEDFEYWNPSFGVVIAVCDSKELAKEYISTAVDKLISSLIEDDDVSLIRKDVLHDGWFYKVLINNAGSVDKYKIYCEEMELNKLMDI